ncbi:response regulator [Phormidium sp. CCY1219]|nr:response regulator [Phormidium sp. CCY1219]
MGYFIEEAADHLNTIQQGLQNLQATVDNPEELAEVFRAAHSIKGGAAMVGLGSIQKIALKLEDSFKVLQESPVQVDPQLESLFLQVFEALQERLETASSAPGSLTSENGEESRCSSEAETIALEKHLKELAKQGGQRKRQPAKSAALPRPEKKEANQAMASRRRDNDEESARQLIFKSDVPRRLQELLHLFKCEDTEQIRQQMQEICRKLSQAGEQFDLHLWCNLIDKISRAIANPNHTYHTLAPIALEQIKQARELILSRRESEITIAPELEALVPLQPVTSSESVIREDHPYSSNVSPMSNHSSKANRNKETSESLNHPTSAAEFSEKTANTAREKQHPKSSEHSGPEVGAAELNSLADLFEGESSYFEETEWQEASAEGENDSAHVEEANAWDLAELTQSDDFEDLLFDSAEIDSSEVSGLPDDDLALLFGSTEFGDLSEPFDGGGESENGEQLETLETSEDNLDDLGDLFQEEATEELQEPDLGEDLWVESNAGKAADMAAKEKSAGGAGDRNRSAAKGAAQSNLNSEDSDFSDLLEITGSDESNSDAATEDNLGLELDAVGVLDELENLFPLDTTETEGDAGTLPSASQTPAEPNAEEEELFAESIEDSADFASSLDNDFADLFETESRDTARQSGEAAGAARTPAKDEEDWLNFDSEDIEENSGDEVFEALGGLFEDINSTGMAQIEEQDSDLASESDLFELETLSDSGSMENMEQKADFYENLEELFELPSEEESAADGDDSSWLTMFDEGNSAGGELVEPAETDTDFEELFASSDEVTAREEPTGVSPSAEPMGAIEREDSDGSSAKADVGAPKYFELEALLELGSPKGSFAELEALLSLAPEGTDGKEAEAQQQQDVHPVDSGLAQGAKSSSVDSASHGKGEGGPAPGKAGDDFADMEELIAHADIGHPSAGGRMTTRRSSFEQTMRVPVRQLDNLSNLVGELVVNRNSIEQNSERMRQFLDNLLHQVSQLTDVGQRMQDLYERSLLEISLLASRQNYHFMAGVSEGQGNGSDENWSALEMDRFTPFHTLSQDILELIVRVRESSSDIEFLVDETEQVTRQLRQITTQLQEGLTRARMVPFSNTADRLPRGVRDNAIKFGKKVELKVEGRETLIDKMILEQLTDPMTHLVNNAIAHGIEAPNERTKKGKPAMGRITIRAFHQGNQTVISVSDDGAGIDSERVKAKALQKGLITPEQAKSMSRLDVYDLLFMAGFSTRDRADDLAGRGVGMDVVRTKLSEIRGVVNIDSNQGKGTTFTIRLPLTLSISKALCCISDRARIAFPMDGVEDMLDVPRDRIQVKDDGQMFIPWRDTSLPFRHLRELLEYNRHLGRGGVYGTNAEEDIISVVVLRSAGNFLALQVDQVLGEQEIVIKQLEGPVPKPVGIAGATVMGDGRIVAIGDVLELIDLAAGRLRREGVGTLWDEDEEAMTTSNEQVVETLAEPTVLIVDDSITVRELLSMTFNKAGYRVEQARDGQEAWEKMRSGLPCDLVFCDIEMPRMDGLELLSRMQKDPQLQSKPIAMLTSRGADKHRQMAVQMGASGYFTKPYLEESLLEAAGRMLKGEKLVSLKAEA